MRMIFIFIYVVIKMLYSRFLNSLSVCSKINAVVTLFCVSNMFVSFYPLKTMSLISCIELTKWQH